MDELDYRSRVWMLFDGREVVSSKDIAAAGVPRYVVHRLVKEDILERLGRGYYALTGRYDNRGVLRAEAIGGDYAKSARGVKPVFVLHTAVMGHGLTNDFKLRELWMAFPKDSRPRFDVATRAGLPVHVVAMEPWMLETDVDEYDYDGCMVRMTSPARTVVDMLRYAKVKSRDGMPVVAQADADAALKRALESRVAPREIIEAAQRFRRAKWLAEHVEDISRTFGY